MFLVDGRIVQISYGAVGSDFQLTGPETMQLEGC